MPKITVMPGGITINAGVGDNLLDKLVEAGVFVSAPCGGNGRCGKCTVNILAGEVDGAEVKNGAVLSCKARISGDITVEAASRIFEAVDIEDEADDGSGSGEYALAVDLGTTTIEAEIVEIRGSFRKKIRLLNPQGALGADIMSRIQAYKGGKGEILIALVRSAIQGIIDGFDKKISSVTVSGNATMLHILAAVSPESMGHYPYTPQFTEMQRDVGERFGINAPLVTLLPSASAFIGSDITAGVAVSLPAGGNRLFVDVGTNGEIVLCRDGVLLAASAAAGPALEGASIECGVGGVSGAISSVSTDGERVFTTTVNGEKAIGICGSGIIDAVAMLVKSGIVDETGAFDYESDSPLLTNLDGDRFYLTDSVYLSQRDIRQVQLAKAAIAATIRALLSRAEISASELDEIQLAGGIGKYMSVQSALTVGLLPKAKQINAVGNTALRGAVACAVSTRITEKTQIIARETEVIDLSADPVFSAAFIEEMSF